MIVYKATNRINQKSYIGKTVEDTICKRKYEHLWSAKNDIGYYFHRALKRYGANNFVWGILFKTDNINELIKKEQDFIFYHKTFCPGGYNLTMGGEGSLGRPVSEETRKKIRESEKKTLDSIQCRQEMSKRTKEQMSRLGMKERLSKKAKERFESKEERERNRVAQIVAQSRPEVREKKSIAMKKHWKEHPEIMGRAAKFRKGKKQSVESNRKRSIALKGRMFTEEHREKIKIALKKRRELIASG